MNVGVGISRLMLQCVKNQYPCSPHLHYAEEGARRSNGGPIRNRLMTNGY